MDTDLDICVEFDSEGAYVELEGVRYRGEDMPHIGTQVLAFSTYTHIEGHQEAYIEWSGDTPSGRCGGTFRA